MAAIFAAERSVADFCAILSSWKRKEIVDKIATISYEKLSLISDTTDFAEKKNLVIRLHLATWLFNF